MIGGLAARHETVRRPVGQRIEATYHVAFPARDLWGEGAEAGDTVVVDLWETYLEEAP